MTTKVSFQAKDLTKALATLGGLVQRKNALPIMGDVLLRWDADRRTFQMVTSDTEAWLTLDAPFLTLLQVDGAKQPEAVCLPYQAVKEAVASLPPLLVTAVIDTDKQTLLLDYQTGQFTMPIDQAAEYPSAPAVVTPDQPTDAQPAVGAKADPVCRLTVDTEWLLPRLKAARVSVASDELRPVMNNVCLDTRHDGLTIASSDGHSMFVETLEAGLGTGFLAYGQFPADSSAQLLVSSGVLSTLTDAFQAAERITLTADTQRIAVEAEGARLVWRMCDARYPNYRSVIPQQQPHTVTLEAHALTGALRRVGQFANDSSNMVVLERQGAELVLQAQDYDFSRSASERIAVQGDTSLPEGQRFGFKCSTLLAMLGCIRTENVLLCLAEPSRAALLKEEDLASNRVCLIMPMLVNE